MYVSDDGDIDILPTDPDMLYVPEYDPSLIFYTPCYGRSFINFGVGFRFGGWLDHDFDWHGRRVIAWDRDHPRPANWWHETPAARRTVIARALPCGIRRREWRVRGTVVIGQGDRGYPTPTREVRPAQRPVEVRPTPGRPAEIRPAPSRPVEVRPTPARPVEVHPAPARPVEVHPAPARPVEVRQAPSRPTVFPDESSRETRASSSRGAESRGVVSRPAPAPAPAPSRPSGGGGNGGGGGGGGRKH